MNASYIKSTKEYQSIIAALEIFKNDKEQVAIALSMLGVLAKNEFISGAAIAFVALMDYEKQQQTSETSLVE